MARRSPPTARDRPAPAGAPAHALRALRRPLWVAYHSHRTVATLEGIVRLTVQVRRCVAPGVPALPPALPAGGGAGLGAAPRGVRPGRHRPGGGAALPGAPHRAGDPPAPAGAGPGHRRAHGDEPGAALRGAARGAPGRRAPAAGGAGRAGAGHPRHRRVAAGRGPRGAVGRAGLPVRRDPAGAQPAERAGGRAGRPAAGGAGGPGGGAGGRRRGRLRRPALHPQRGGQRRCPACPTSCATSTTSRRRPCRSTRPTATPRSCSRRRCAGVRPLERALEAREAAAGPAGDPEAAAVRGYCLAVRSALTDDGRPPLAAAGLRLRERLTAIRASVARVQARAPGKGGLRAPARTEPARPPAGPRPGGDRRPGRPSSWPSAGSTGPRTSWATTRPRTRRRVRAAYAAAAGGDAPPAGRGRGYLAPAVDRFLRVTASYAPGAVPLLHGGGAAPHRQRPGARLRGRPLPRAAHDRAQGGLPRPGGARGGAGRGRGGHPRAGGPSASTTSSCATRPPWRAGTQLRGELAFRHEARRAQLRFRRAPARLPRRPGGPPPPVRFAGLGKKTRATG